MKITANVLAQKIVDYVITIAGDLAPEDILQAVPELKGFDLLADTVETCYQDAQGALLGNWDRGDDGFMATMNA